MSRTLSIFRRLGGARRNNFSMRSTFEASSRYSVGRIAIEIELSLVPLTCSTNGLAESSYFMVLPALGAFLMLAKPAKVPSLGARSGGVGSLASAGVASARVTPLDGNAASAPPDVSLARSGAVSAARSRSIGHLNLSQPLGSSAAQAGAAPSNSNAMRKGARMSVHRDHDVGGLYNHRDFTAGLDAEFIDRLVGDRRGDDLATADVDADMRGGRTFLTSTTVPLIWLRALMRIAVGKDIAAMASCPVLPAPPCKRRAARPSSLADAVLAA